MAQRIQQMPESAMPYAQQALPYSSTKRGLGAMTLPNPGMKNGMDGGNFSKPYANAQDQRNAELAMQNVRQNNISAQPQALAGASGQARRQLSEQSDQESKAQLFMNMNLANQLEKNSPGGAISQLANQPYATKVMNDVAVSQAMYQQGQAPELGQMIQEANRYA